MSIEKHVIFVIIVIFQNEYQIQILLTIPGASDVGDVYTFYSDSGDNVIEVI